MVRKTKEEAEQTRRHIIEAARRVFHECGVTRTSLEKIAAAAGVTRGAVYWHFKNKTELFFAMREEAVLPFLDRAAFDETTLDPLADIERVLLEIVRILEDHPPTRETFEILIYKCEYVDEFSGMMPCTAGQLDFLRLLGEAYARAHSRGQLREATDPQALAYDTFLFVGGLIKHWIANTPAEVFRVGAAGMIRQHLALRRA